MLQIASSSSIWQLIVAIIFNYPLKMPFIHKNCINKLPSSPFCSNFLHQRAPIICSCCRNCISSLPSSTPCKPFCSLKLQQQSLIRAKMLRKLSLLAQMRAYCRNFSLPACTMQAQISRPCSSLLKIAAVLSTFCASCKVWSSFCMKEMLLISLSILLGLGALTSSSLAL